jgi:hypothetical protein
MFPEALCTLIQSEECYIAVVAAEGIDTAVSFFVFCLMLLLLFCCSDVLMLIFCTTLVPAEDHIVNL